MVNKKYVHNNIYFMSLLQSVMRRLSYVAARLVRRLLDPKASNPCVAYGWSGDYCDWESAKKETTGYNHDDILCRTVASARLVRDGEAVFERDSVIFQKAEFSWPLVAVLMHVAAVSRGRLRVLDIGGALGSTYFQNRPFLHGLSGVSWCVVEQDAYVAVGKREFENGELFFAGSLDDGMATAPDVILLSSVMQYLERPYDYLEAVVQKEVDYLIIDRTGFTLTDADRLTVQRVPPWIYSASYPCWFFGRSRMLNLLHKRYELIAEFDALDRANIPSRYAGFLLRKKQENIYHGAPSFSGRRPQRDVGL